MTRLSTVSGLAMVALLATSGCDKSGSSGSSGSSGKTASGSSGKTASGTPASANAAIEARLVSSPWTGLLEHKVIQIVFVKKKTVTAEIRYMTFGHAYATDKVDVTIDSDGTITLRGKPENPLVGSAQAHLDALVGKLSDDKTDLGGGVAETPASWSVSTSKSLSDFEKPFDVAEAEKALLAGQWEGKIAGKPGKLVFSRKKGALVAKLTRGNEVSTVSVVAADGMITLKAAPIPTSQGLLTQNGKGYFVNDKLEAMMGSYRIETQQGFMTQSSSESWKFQNLKAGQPATKTKTKKK